MTAEPEAAPAPPAHLGDKARAEWDRLDALRLARGAPAFDYTALTAYCIAYARWTEAEAEVARLGSVVKAKSGAAIPNPFLAVAEKAMAAMTRQAEQLGLAALSRDAAPPAPEIVTKSEFARRVRRSP